VLIAMRIPQPQTRSSPDGDCCSLQNSAPTGPVGKRKKGERCEATKFGPHQINQSPYGKLHRRSVALRSMHDGTARIEHAASRLFSRDSDSGFVKVQSPGCTRKTNKRDNTALPLEMMRT
jgi:hypothetical protein